MKKLPIILCFLFTLGANAQWQLPQLKVGEFVNDSIESISYCSSGCTGTGNPDEIISMDTNFIPVASGVTLQYVVTKLTGSAYTTEWGILNLYDTLTFSRSHNTVNIYFTAYGCMLLKLMITGTPTVPLENYYCFYGQACSLGSCPSDCGLAHYSKTQCSVENFNGIKPIDNAHILITPNPAANYFEINYDSWSPELQLILTDFSGHEIKTVSLSNPFSDRINSSDMNNGLYFWMVTDKKRTFKTGKLLINKVN